MSPTIHVPGSDVPTFIGDVLAAPEASCRPVNVFVNPSVATVAVEDGPVIVTPFGMVNVPVEVVIARPLIEVAVATPRTGVTRVGVSLNTNRAVPVSSEILAEMPADVVRLVITPVVVATRMMPVESVDSACSALRVEFGVCVMYVASVGAAEDAQLPPVPDTTPLEFACRH